MELHDIGGVRNSPVDRDRLCGRASVVLSMVMASTAIVTFLVVFGSGPPTESGLLLTARPRRARGQWTHHGKDWLSQRHVVLRCTFCLPTSREHQNLQREKIRGGHSIVAFEIR